ncbi:MAG: YigZ family protein [bacterium]
MSADSFLTVARRHQQELKVNRSRFLATAIPVASRDAAEAAYQEVKREYYDATHNCFAYRIGLGEQPDFRYSDDGEPSGTAGKPIYEAINHFGLTDVLIVVTRYFGGIKLGTGGLARAYRDSARAVLEAAEVIERIIEQSLRIHFAHEQTSVVMRLLAEFELQPESTNYGDEVTIEVAVRLSLVEKFMDQMRDRSLGKVQVEAL